MYKIIGGDGREYGPVAAEQLRQWISEGRITAQTNAQSEGSTDWKPLSAYPEFAPLLRSSPPVIPAAVVAPRPRVKTSGLAIASLVLGILGLCFSILTALPGLILGIVGLVKINRSGGRVSGQGLAIAGICVSGVSLLVCPIQVGMLLPVLNTAREKSHRAACLGNLRYIGVGMRLYAADHGGRFPADAAGTTVGSFELLVKGGYMTVPKLWVCPSDRGVVPAVPGAPLTPQNLSYAYGGFGLTESVQPDTPLVCDRTSGDVTSRMPWVGNTLTHKSDGGCVLYADGHVAFTKTASPPMYNGKNPQPRAN